MENNTKTLIATIITAGAAVTAAVFASKDKLTKKNEGGEVEEYNDVNTYYIDDNNPENHEEEVNGVAEPTGE